MGNSQPFSTLRKKKKGKLRSSFWTSVLEHRLITGLQVVRHVNVYFSRYFVDRRTGVAAAFSLYYLLSAHLSFYISCNRRLDISQPQWEIAPIRPFGGCQWFVLFRDQYLSCLYQ